MNKQLLQQALVALESVPVAHAFVRPDQSALVFAAKEALRAAIAQPVPPAAAWRERAIFLIHYDDQDQRPEIWTGEAAGRARFKTVGMSWNAHLFVKVASNSRDDIYADSNAPMLDDIAQPAPPCRGCTEQSEQTSLNKYKGPARFTPQEIYEALRST